jgi:hypothetical protein
MTVVKFVQADLDLDSESLQSLWKPLKALNYQ